MITPDEFPYIKSLYVNDCYAYKDFNIELHDYKPFSHLILTGKNGSGKSTILRTLDKRIMQLRFETNEFIDSYRRVLNSDSTLEESQILPNGTEEIGRILPTYWTVYDLNKKIKPEHIWRDELGKTVYLYVKAARQSKVSRVETVTKESEFSDQLIKDNSEDFFIKKFVQYLVNKKVNQAFDQLNNNQNEILETERFFKKLTEIFQRVFEDNGLQLEFVRERFTFYIKLFDQRQVTFNVLSEGFSALFSILMDLFIRVDLIRKQVNDYSYNPCGIVLIDEPETHLHLQLQEQVLPLLTSLFPNVQFIAATHSPAVIASIKNATIFDLTTKESRGSEGTVGRSYSELMRGHFGLNNEYSSIADELFRKADQILKEYKNQPDQLKIRLQQFFVENDAYLSPSFRVELESMILENA